MQKLNLSVKFSEILKNGNLSKIFDKLKGDKKTLLIILIGLTGIFIIMLVPSGNGSTKKEESSVTDNYNTDNIQTEVEALIESIKGAGEAKVLITYESNTENVYAINVDEKSDGNDLHYKSEYIVTNEDQGLILKIIYPKVRGVAVICEGGNDPQVKQKIYSVISALFDISTNKISVTDMR